MARWYGRKVPLQYLRSMADINRLGLTVGDLVEILRTLGMDAEAVRLSHGYLETLPLPAILYWDQKHFVLLYEVDIKRRRCKIVDPSRGKLSFTFDELIEHWCGEGENGVAILADPTEAFDSMEYPALRSKGLKGLLVETLRRYKGSFAIVALLSLVTMGAEMVLPLLMQRTVDDGITAGDLGLVWMLILGQLMVFAGNSVAAMISEFMLTRMGLRVSFGMLGKYLHKVVSLPMEFFERKSPGDLMQKVAEHTRIQQFLVTLPETVVFASLGVVVFSGILIWMNHWIFMLFMAFTAVTALWSWVFIERKKQLDYTYIHQYTTNHNHLYELIYGMPEIKTNNAQKRRVGIWQERQTSLNHITERSTILGFWLNGGNSFLLRVRDICITGICAALVIRGEMTLGAMMTVSYIVGRISGPFNTLVDAFQTVQLAGMSYERIEEISETEIPERKPIPDDFKAGDIVLENVSFKYPGSASPYILQGIELTIPKGSTVAVVGPSGCGKTTLIKLMLGFFPPSTGRITVGGVPMAHLGEERWLDLCGTVMQDGYIFSGSIMHNIAIATDTPDIDRVNEAVRLACLDEFIATLPMGLNTRIGATGVQLSGGQKQRLLIARAFYKQPEYLFFDEATSSLDSGNERRIVSNIDRFRADRTVIIAAHRLSTVRSADLILYVDRGRVTEAGTHDELVRTGGDYYNLVRNQLADS